MPNVRVAKRYAEALIQEAQYSGLLDEVTKDLVTLRKAIHDSADFRIFLKSPVIKKDKKQEVIKNAFEGRIQNLSLIFLLLLIEKERENLLQNIIETFMKLREDVLGIVNVDVKTAIELNPEQLEKLQRKLEDVTKKKVNINLRIDKSLIGGFIAFIDDEMIDASVKHQLELLKGKLIEEQQTV